MCRSVDDSAFAQPTNLAQVSFLGPARSNAPFMGTLPVWRKGDHAVANRIHHPLTVGLAAIFSVAIRPGIDSGGAPPTVEARAAGGPTTWGTQRHERSAEPVPLGREQPLAATRAAGSAAGCLRRCPEGLSASETRSNPYGFSSMIPDILVPSAAFEFKRCLCAVDPQNH
jgi:hypothetical protein